MSNNFDYSKIVLLIARQRSGTHVLQETLMTCGEIFCYGEVFYPNGDSLKLKTNFFNYKLNQPKEMALPENAERLFLEYIKFLHTEGGKKYTVLDIKYNSLLHIVGPWQGFSVKPYIFSLAEKYGIRIIHLTRRNYLRIIISAAIAEANNTWATNNINDIKKQKVTINPDILEGRFKLYELEDKLIRQYLGRYKKYFTFDYDEMFPYQGACMDKKVLGRLISWLSLKTQLTPNVRVVKQSKCPLCDAIENYSEVEQALGVTAYNYCLQDERQYTVEKTLPTSC